MKEREHFESFLDPDNDYEKCQESIQKLLEERPRTFKYLIRETGEKDNTVTTAVARLVDKGKVIIDNFIGHEDKPFEAQLKLTFNT